MTIYGYYNLGCTIVKTLLNLGLISLYSSINIGKNRTRVGLNPDPSRCDFFSPAGSSKIKIWTKCRTERQGRQPRARKNGRATRAQKTQQSTRTQQQKPSAQKQQQNSPAGNGNGQQQQKRKGKGGRGAGDATKAKKKGGRGAQ
jgi:hypothetical protein